MVAAHEEIDIDEGKLLELLEIYMDLVTKQDTVIYHMGNVIVRQARELEHYKNLHGFLDVPGQFGIYGEMEEAREALKEYENCKAENE